MSDPSDTPADAAAEPGRLPQHALPERRSSGRFLPLLSLLLTVGLAGVVWQQQVALRSLSVGQSLLSDTRAALATVEADNVRLVAEGQSLAASLAELRSALQQIQTAEQQSQSVLLLQQLGELASVLRLAELRVQVMSDVEGARVLLLAADVLLARIDLPAADSLRRQLAGYLQALPTADASAVVVLNGRLAAVDRAQQQLRPSTSRPAPTPTADANPPTTPDDATWLQRVQRWLGQVFVITRRAEAMTPLLTPEQEWLLHQRLSLSLQQAQLAALQGQQPLFAEALKQAQLLVTDHLEGEGKAALLEELLALQQTGLRAPLPSLASVIADVERLQQQLAPAAAAGSVP